MTTVTKNRARQLPDPQFDGVPYGNAVSLHYTFATNAFGAMVDSDVSAAVGNGDKVILGVIPGGTKLIDAKAIISDAFTAATTADVGFEYVDGVDDADVPQDANYFFSAVDTASAARLSANNTGVAPVVLAKDSYLVMTVGGAAHDSAGQVDIVVDGVLMGRK